MMNIGGELKAHTANNLMMLKERNKTNYETKIKEGWTIANESAYSTKWYCCGVKNDNVGFGYNQKVN